MSLLHWGTRDHLELLFSVGACSKYLVIASEPPELDVGGAAMQVLVCRVQAPNSSRGHQARLRVLCGNSELLCCPGHGCLEK